MRSPPNQRGSGFHFHSPHAWGMHLGAHGMPYKLTLGIPQVPTVPRRSSRNDSTAATDNTLNTPMRDHTQAPPAYPERLWGP